jgi:D-glycero-D-manno-heptose 1,7-bisphosphate phosphatase
MNKASHPVVFLDRDGTLNEEIGYIHNVDHLQLIPGAAEAIIRLNKAGVAAVLVTNQSGAARGYYEEEHIINLNKRLVDLLDKQGAHLDAVYYCPHLPDGVVEKYTSVCQCRKPEPGMVAQAFEEHPHFDRSRSYVVGDKATDVELAHNCGSKGVLVRTGYGERVLEGTYQWKVQPDYTAGDIQDAINWILTDLKPEAS